VEDAKELHALAHCYREEVRDEQRAAEHRVKRAMIQLGLFRRDLVRVVKLAENVDASLSNLHGLLQEHDICDDICSCP
jgi:hypothetical protein